MPLQIVYIAGPFRSSTSYGQTQNIRHAEEVALEVWGMGAVALCPHLNTANFQGALPDQTWLDGDLALLERCDAVLMTGDWEMSAGACTEQEFALDAGIPVFYSLGELFDWLGEQDRAAA